MTHGGSHAFYRPSTDSIVLPPIEAFMDAESYYATLAHETIHDADVLIMPRRMSRQSKRSDNPTRLIGIITVLRGTRATCRPAGTVRDWTHEP